MKKKKKTHCNLKIICDPDACREHVDILYHPREKKYRREGRQVMLLGAQHQLILLSEFQLPQTAQQPPLLMKRLRPTLSSVAQRGIHQHQQRSFYMVSKGHLETPCSPPLLCTPKEPCWWHRPHGHTAYRTWGWPEEVVRSLFPDTNKENKTKGKFSSNLGMMRVLEHAQQIMVDQHLRKHSLSIKTTLSKITTRTLGRTPWGIKIA